MKHMNNTRLASLSIAIGVALSGTYAFAAESNKNVKEDEIERVEIVGSATNLEVTAEDIQKIQANDLNDIFRLEPSVTVGGGGLGITQLVFVRGFEDTMLNVTVDGAPQTGTLFHHIGRLSIEPELLKSVQVQAGAGEATAGSGAIGGAIRFKTKTANDLLADNEQFGGIVKVGGGTNDFVKYSATGYGKLTDNWSVLASHVRIDTDSYEDGNGNEIAFEYTDENGNLVRETTDTEQELSFVKLNGEFGDNQFVSLSHEIREESGNFPSRPNFPISARNPIYPIETERNTTVFNYQWLASPMLNLEFTLYNTEQELIVRGDRAWHPYQGNIQTIGGDLRNTSYVAAHTLTYGVEYRDQTSEAGSIGQPLSGEETGKVLGIYVQDHWDITPDLMLSFGVRYDDYELDTTHKFYAESEVTFAQVAAQVPTVADAGFFVIADFSTLTPLGQVVGPNGTFNTLSRTSEDVTVDSDGFSANIGVAYQLNDAVNLTAGYAQALRGKEVGDTFTIDYNGVEPDIQAEDAENAEIGIEYNKDGLLARVAAYQSRLDNAMNLEIGGTNVRNIGDIESDGVEIKLGYITENYSVIASYVHNTTELYNYQPNTSTIALDANGAPIVNLSSYSADFNAFDVAKIDAPALVDGEPLIYNGIKVEGYEQRALGNSRGDTYTINASYYVTDALELGWFFTYVDSLGGITTLQNAAATGDTSDIFTLTKPSYATHDFFAVYQVSENLTARLMVKNAFDEAYRDHSSFADYSEVFEGFASHLEPGRDIRLNVEYQF
ncbi:ligand-gated channel [Alteromonas sp. KC3]|nr:ligand-gated channel [Alteromonas sp. KC3]BCO23087.1 ligand-gated channel [Alteromonas sp. KC14]